MNTGNVLCMCGEFVEYKDLDEHKKKTSCLVKKASAYKFNEADIKETETLIKEDCKRIEIEKDDLFNDVNKKINKLSITVFDIVYELMKNDKNLKENVDAIVTSLILLKVKNLIDITEETEYEDISDESSDEEDEIEKKENKILSSMG